jgi:hypothetical protein
MVSFLRCTSSGFGFMHSNQFLAMAAAALSLSAGIASSPQSLDHAQALNGQASTRDEPGYPITISQPGHYRLTSDLLVPPHADGIVITAPGVTLDLNGHSITGPVHCRHAAGNTAVACDWLAESSSRAGINTEAAPGAVVRDGTVQGFAGSGILYGAGAVLERLEVLSNAGAGISGSRVAAGGIVRDVLSRHNGGHGIVCDGLHVERSTFVENGGNGADCRRTEFVHSVSRGNAGFGMTDGFKPGLRAIQNRRGAVASARVT